MIKTDIKPLITVVTVVFNDVENIEKTIQSVINQTYPNIEYVIIDGASTDGTIEKIYKYKDNISKIITEPDKGIYDAMNKGTEKATGDWIIYMNSGDRFFDLDVLSKIFIGHQDKIKNKSVIYTDACSENNGRFRRSKPRSLDHLWIGTLTSHQSIIVKMNLAKERRYNIKFTIAADYDFIYFIYKGGAKFLYLDDLFIALCDGSEGLSKTAKPKVILTQGFNVAKQYAKPYQIFLKAILNTARYIYATAKALV